MTTHNICSSTPDSVQTSSIQEELRMDEKKEHTVCSGSSSPHNLRGKFRIQSHLRPPMIDTIHAIHPQMVMNKLRPIKRDFLSYVESHGGSISQLSFSVNDAAGGKKFDECYEKLDVLGEGGFAEVYLCEHKERGHTYAVKEIFKENFECTGQSVKEEVNALKQLRDVPYIVKLMDVFQGYEVTHMIMEEMMGGDLLERLCEIDSFSEPDARKVSRRLLEALYFCHKKHIVHRDVKPENILLANKHSNTQIKLADFGCARKFDPINPTLRTFCGSPQYVAPEIYMQSDGYDDRCDIWSAGVVIYVILGGYAPFDGEDYQLPKIICAGEFEFHETYWSEISQLPQDLITSLLVTDPTKRITLEEALDGQWLRRKDMDTIKRKTAVDSSISNFDAWCQSQHSVSSSGDGSSHTFDLLELSERSIQSGDL